MNRLTLFVFALLILAIGGGVSWYLIDTRNEAFSVQAPVATSTPEMNEGLAIYTNGPYGFSIFYPEASTVSYTFDSSYHLGSVWRENALPGVEGSSIVSVIPYSVSSEDSFPRYFNAMVRIGASTDPEEIKRCEVAAEAQAETRLPDAMIHGHTWSAFSFQSAGMMQYAEGVSYRTVFEGKCIALEKVRTGSSYLDDAPSPKDIRQETLDAEYAKLDAIISTFSFAR